jgi:tRNA pseudouridine13 synthase
MKLKCQPEDFHVEERTAFAPDGGPLALYRLTKRGMGTPEAVEAVLKRWHIPRDRVSFGGLKDRHAVTVQHVTIRNGPRRNLKQTHIELTYVGQCSRPFGPKDIVSNAFTIALRDMSDEEATRVAHLLVAGARDGVPNYFDEQRFGSVGRSGDFIARAWCLGDYERTLWLILADPNPHDRSRPRAERTVIRNHWGDWGRLAAKLGRSPWHDVLKHLADHPHDYRGAIAPVRQDLRSIYLAALQSHLWNLMLAQLLRQRLPADRLVAIRVAGQPLPFPRGLESGERETLRLTELPLPSARSRDLLEPWQESIQEAAGTLGLTLSQLRVKYPRDSFFSKGNRSAMFFPGEVGHRVEPDEFYSGRKKLVFQCELPRGAYATILTRSIGAAASDG